MAFFLYISAHRTTLAGGWSNGKAADSDSAYRGSSPRPPAKQIQALIEKLVSAFLFFHKSASTLLADFVNLYQ